MKTHTVNLTMAALRAAGVHTNKATVTVMGVSYKKDVSDTRESPAVEIIEELSKKVKRVIIHDPNVRSIETPIGFHKSASLKTALSEADCLVFVTDHTEFAEMTPRQLRGKKVKAVVDTRNLYSRDAVEYFGMVYRGLGSSSLESWQACSSCPAVRFGNRGSALQE